MIVGRCSTPPLLRPQTTKHLILCQLISERRGELLRPLLGPLWATDIIIYYAANTLGWGCSAYSTIQSNSLLSICSTLKTRQSTFYGNIRMQLGCLSQNGRITVFNMGRARWAYTILQNNKLPRQKLLVFNQLTQNKITQNGWARLMCIDQQISWTISARSQHTN